MFFCIGTGWVRISEQGRLFWEKESPPCLLTRRAGFCYNRPWASGAPTPLAIDRRYQTTPRKSPECIIPLCYEKVKREFSANMTQAVLDSVIPPKLGGFLL